MKTLYLVGGTMGVARRRSEAESPATQQRILDGDWCWDMHPFQITEETKAMVLDNICHLPYNFSAALPFRISSSSGSCMSSPSWTVFLRGWI